MKLSVVLLLVVALSLSVQARVDKSACSLPVQPGPCFALFQKFYYDSASKQCKEFNYGGCAGNANRFSTKAECEKVCKS